MSEPTITPEEQAAAAALLAATIPPEPRADDAKPYVPTKGPSSRAQAKNHKRRQTAKSAQKALRKRDKAQKATKKARRS
jgi:hypothetical protein